MATMLVFSNAITETYKTTSDAIKDVRTNDKLVIRKSLTELMRQSFFHGANRFGNNFIA